MSCSKDGKIIQQLFSDAQRPVERAVCLLKTTYDQHELMLHYFFMELHVQPPVGLSFRPDGCISHACSESIAHRTKTVHQ